MSKEKKKISQDEEVRRIKVTLLDEKHEERNIADFAKEIMTIFGANVNISRNIPDIKDGLMISSL